MGIGAYGSKLVKEQIQRQNLVQEASRLFSGIWSSPLERHLQTDCRLLKNRQVYRNQKPSSKEATGGQRCGSRSNAVKSKQKTPSDSFDDGNWSTFFTVARKKTVKNPFSIKIKSYKLQEEGRLEFLKCAVSSGASFTPAPVSKGVINQKNELETSKQRLKAAITIRSLINPDRYIIVVEHDLSVLDYLSDFICCLYGIPSAYGVVTMPFSVREGINIFLDGYVPTENLRFRDASLVFKVAETANEEEVKKMCMYKYPGMKKKMGEFELAIVAGEFTDSEIMVMLGENGTGKTTFIRMLAGRLKPDEGAEVPVLNVSYKPQKISPKSTGSVRQLLHEKIRDAYTHLQFVTDVMKPLQIENIINQEVQTLSGGELQRVALALCLGKPADVYLIDEPSAYLDSEQRLMAARVVKRFILHAKKTAFVVEHDFIMATYLADRVIVFDGVPSKNTVANSPQTLLAGMNKFLSQLETTFRRDPNNYRPRINKLNSIKDVEQKKSGNYFFLDD
ncbi:ATP-binding cassette sub-family E member 1-like [Dama dama]|uniref:ATP-binding cassette sub-family E member 1-like n=1 Tax=Dama dama TaxID=30532 RepID=UPI002A35C327|nr:ATP-binding cassette sub-family E member 1-like [Dama dama]